MPVFDASVHNPRRVKAARTAQDDFARAVRAGLSRSPRELPSTYLYDAVGSALFEVITLLPEYGLSRADERLLRLWAQAMVQQLPRSLLVAELGSGSGRKTRWLLEALAARERLSYFPIDVSATALLKCRQELSELGAVSLVGLEASYLDGLQEVAARRRPGQSLLVLFLGSTIGNFSTPQAEHFLREIRRRQEPGDMLLIGTDLEKDVQTMLLAYADPTGVTAAFNLNLLARINRELGGDFKLSGFEHVVRYDAVGRRIEMHLRSRHRQTVSIPAANLVCQFREGETIWTETCHKFRIGELAGMAERTGYVPLARWVDQEWPFAESLWVAAPNADPNADP
ncbi:MAG: L-histidine N(alpha)-methyltransferase [Nitrospira sp.]|nr:L-histidine N(alpha)-methyltransferase [Nitrospira sp.]